MKMFLTAFLMILSFSLFANVDELVGSYASKDRDGSATITKYLVTPANLFEPAVYGYRLEMERSKHSLYAEMDLEVSRDGKSLSASQERECDDPGCYYFNSIDVSVSKPARGKAQINVEYDGFHYADGDEDEFYFNGKAVFIKK